MTIFDGTLWMLGCGNMGGAMLSRWIEAGLDPAQVTVVTRGSRDMPDGVRHLRAFPAGERPDLLMLTIKPQQLDTVAPSLAAIGRVPVVVSILAGVEDAAIRGRVDADVIVRAMPNLPVAIGRGVVALQNEAADDDLRTRIERLMAPLGLVEWIADPARFDAVTALAGCGPAFLFRFADALATAGAALGLDREQAGRLAIATVDGAARMAAAADVGPDVLADRVASPGGSTREGLNVLDRDAALVTLVTATLAASERRNRAMADEARIRG